jgi:serine/threonine-protein kinase
MLTGSDAHSLEGDGLDDIKRLIDVVCESEPRLPSKAAASESNAASFASRLRGDLDHILLKALAKDPEHRYATVSQLADDLRRHLSGLPVRARNASLAYRLGSFTRRHRLGIGLACALLLILVGLGINAGLQWRRTQEALEVADVQRARAEAINELLVSMLRSASPAQGGTRQVTVLEALQSSERSITTSLAGQAGLEAAVRRRVGEIYAELGFFEEAEPMLRAALELLQDERHQEGRNEENQQQLELATTWNSLGQLLRSCGRLEEAAEALENALKIRELLLGPDDTGTLAVLNNIAGLMRARGELDRAEELFRRARAAYLRVGNEQALLGAALTLQNIGAVQVSRSSYAEALETLQQALVELREHRGPEHPDTLTVLQNVCVLGLNTGDYRGAERNLREILRLRIEILGDGHPKVAATRQMLATALRNLGDLQTSEQLLQEVLARRLETLGPVHRDVGLTFANLAAVRLERGEVEAALETIGEALDVLVAAGDRESGYYASALSTKAQAHLRQGRMSQAVEEAREALELRCSLYGEQSHGAGLSLALIAEITRAQGRPNEAEPIFWEALEILESKLEPASRHLLSTRIDLARCLRDIGRRDQAEEQLKIVRSALEASDAASPAIRQALAEMQGAIDSEDHRSS